MASNPKKLFTPEEYLAMEREASYKSEYFDGEIFAMAGASEEHNLIAGNIFASLHSQTSQHGCRAYISDMRIDMSKKGLYAYPNVVIVYGESKFSDHHKDNLTNPTVIIEVLSKSTEAKDRGIKFMRYRKLDSFVEYLLVSQDRPNIEHYVRQSDNRWVMTESSGIEDTVTLSSIQCAINMSDVYAMISFNPEQET